MTAAAKRLGYFGQLTSRRQPKAPEVMMYIPSEACAWEKILARLNFLQSA